MLDELEAISFEYQINFETRTHPWVILAHGSDTGLESYIVKLFSREEVEQNYAVAKEVFASVIAGELELSIPEPALINMSSGDFMASLSDDLANVINTKDYRIKFGSKYIDGTLPYNKNINLDDYFKLGHIDSIFAYDCLIHNRDRSTGKPDNIRFKNDRYYLIDHEYSLGITQKIISEFNDNRWVYDFTNHIFYYFLIVQRDKSKLFQDFEDKLSKFNPDVLDSYEAQLRKHHFNPPYEDYQLLKNYLAEIVVKSKKFLFILKKIMAA